MPLELDFSRPSGTESDQRPKIAHRPATRLCDVFDGPETGYRERAVHLAWVIDEVDLPVLAWPTPICGTPKCLNLGHLTWMAPRFIDYPKGVCVYCGLSADTKDHLLPRTWTGEGARHHVIVVPACMECNSLISDRYAPAVNERRMIAHKSLRKRGKKILGMPDWEPEEIAKMGKTLRSTIERGMHTKRLLLARLAWPEDPTYDMRAMQKSGIENPYAVGLLTDLTEMAA